MTIKINEIYKTIQGESSYAGLPCVIVRVMGCNLRCVYCDTRHAYKNGEDWSVNDILKKIDTYGCKLITITGGEPLIQKEIYPLTEILLRNNYKVLIETNGSIDISRLSDKIIRIVDIKCPDSNMTDHVYWKNLECLNALDEVKFVLSSERDYRWALQVIHEYSVNKICKVIFSPVSEKLNPNHLAQLMITGDDSDIRLQVQMHKLIGCK